jgi:hypothetical protein
LLIKKGKSSSSITTTTTSKASEDKVFLQSELKIKFLWSNFLSEDFHAAN